MSRTIWTVGLLIALAAAPARGDAPISPDKFADATLTILSLDANRERRVGASPFKLIVLAPPRSTSNQARLIQEALGRPSRTSLSFTTELREAPRQCSRGFFTPPEGTAAVVAVELPKDCVENLFPIARQKQILTITTKKDDVEPIGIGIVAEHNQVVVYRSDVALKAEGVRLPPDFLSLTRSAASNDYRENYREAMRAFDFKDWNEAKRRLRTAAALNPNEGGQRVVIYGVRIQAYLPHYYLGLVYSKLNKPEDACAEWRISSQQDKIRISSEEFNDLQKQLTQCPSMAAVSAP